MMKLDEKVKVKLPKAKGMEVIGIEPNFPIENFVNLKGKNSVRFSQTDEKAIGDLMRIIKNGDYEPEYEIPPVVVIDGDGKAELISGFHRMAAHRLSGKKTMYVASARFYAESGKTAEYWKIQWKLIENKKNQFRVETERTEEDIVGTIVNMVQDGEISDEETDIEKALKDAELTATEVATCASKILKKLNKHDRAVDRVEDKDLKKYANDFSLKYGVETLTVTFQGKNDSLYDARLMAKIMKQIMNGTKPTVIARINGANQSKVLDVRKEKKENLLTKFVEMEEFVDYVRENDIDIEDYFELKYAPQLHNEGKEVV